MDPRLTQAANTLRNLREQQASTLSSQLSQTNHNVLNESIGEPYPDIPYTVQSYTLDGNNVPNKLELQLPSTSSSSSSSSQSIVTSDIPVNTYILPSQIKQIRYSIPSPHNEPLVKSGPSMKRIATYRKTMQGESMCIESHCGMMPTSGEEGTTTNNNDDDASLSSSSLASVAPPFKSAFDPTTPVTQDIYNNFRDFVSRQEDTSTATYAERVKEQMRIQQLRGIQPELIPNVFLFPKSYTEAEANIQDPYTLATNHRIDQRLHYEQPYRTVNRCINFRNHYDQLGKQLVHEQQQVSSSSSNISTTPKDFYTEASKELLTSLSLFRYGLQEIHATRQRQNAQLNRDPSNTQFIHYQRSLPYGRGISLYPNNTGIYTIPRTIPSVGSSLLVPSN